MVFMGDREADGCDRCDRTDVETTKHVIRFFDDRDPERGDLCPSCVRKVREADNAVRSIT